MRHRESTLILYWDRGYCAVEFDGSGEWLPLEGVRSELELRPVTGHRDLGTFQSQRYLVNGERVGHFAVVDVKLLTTGDSDLDGRPKPGPRPPRERDDRERMYSRPHRSGLRRDARRAVKKTLAVRRPRPSRFTGGGRSELAEKRFRARMRPHYVAAALSLDHVL